MPRTRSPERLERILDAALGAFLELGYRRTRLSDVAERAEVSVGTLYLYAAGKEALFELLLRRALGERLPEVGELAFEGSAGEDLAAWVWERFGEIAHFPVLERAAASTAEPGDPRQEMEDVLLEVWAWMSRYWRAIELVERCAHDWPELHLLYYKQFRRSVFARATALIQRRMDQGGLRSYPDAGTLVRVLTENIAFFAMHRHSRADSEDLDEDVCRETVLGMLLAGLDPSPRSASLSRGEAR